MANEVAVIRDYDIRDKKLVDATAQSTINSTDAIEMKTTDGNLVFIDKASFIKAVGQAFTASDPKIFTKLLGMNEDGPMGIGTSDLKSVLGVGADFTFGSSGRLYDSVTTTLKSPSKVNAQMEYTYYINQTGNNYEIGFLHIMNGTITRNILKVVGSSTVSNSTFSLSTAYNGNIIVNNPNTTGKEWWNFTLSYGIALK